MMSCGWSVDVSQVEDVNTTDYGIFAALLASGVYNSGYKCLGNVKYRTS